MTEDQEFTTVPCPAFSEIGQKFGPIDLCAIPIGALVNCFFFCCCFCNSVSFWVFLLIPHKITIHSEI